MPPTYSESVRLQIDDPQAQMAVIDALYARYQAMRASTGQPPLPPDGALFRQFIAQAHKRVARQYHCRSVQFQFTARDRQVTITAAPVEETR